MRPRVLLPALMGVLFTTACRETLDPAPRPVAAVAADQHLAQLVIVPGDAGDQWVVRVALGGGVAAPRVGGFRARLVIPSGLSIASDVADQGRAQGAMMRAVREDGGDVHATGAAADGMAQGDLFVVTVRGNASALAMLRLELEELVDVAGADRRRHAVIANRVDDSRIRR